MAKYTLSENTFMKKCVFGPWHFIWNIEIMIMMADRNNSYTLIDNYQ